MLNASEALQRSQSSLEITREDRLNAISGLIVEKASMGYCNVEVDINRLYVRDLFQHLTMLGYSLVELNSNTVKISWEYKPASEQINGVYV